jgi:hypothetical protein
MKKAQMRTMTVLASLSAAMGAVAIAASASAQGFGGMPTTGAGQETFGGLPALTPQGRAKMERRAQQDARVLPNRREERPAYVVVDKGGPNRDRSRQSYDSIQEAVDAVAWGGVVVVMPGVYNENVTLSRSVSLQGDRGPGMGVEIRPLDETKPCLSFQPMHFNDHAMVSNVSFRPAWKRTMGVEDVSFQHDPLNVGSDLVGDDVPCIDVEGGVFSLIQATVDGEGAHRGDLISIKGGTALLEKNKVSGGHRGIAVNQTHALWDRTMLIDNIVANNLIEGVHLDGVASMLATGNLINSNGRGLVYSGNGAATLVGNKILNNDSHGVLLDQDARQVLVRLNQIWSNKGDGIKVFNSGGLIEDNDIDGNKGYEISTIGHLDNLPIIINDVAANKSSPRNKRWANKPSGRREGWAIGDPSRYY